MSNVKNPQIQLPFLRVIPVSTQSGEWNMAADEYLFSHSTTPTLRFYQWSVPTLSFGRNCQDSSDISLPAVKKNNIQQILRKTGGRTVLHHHELTYSFISPLKILPYNILQTYSIISTLLCHSFSIFNITPAMKEKTHKHTKTTLCFYEPSTYEITVNNKKIIGSAQSRNQKSFLQHGSILLAIDWKLWQDIWNITDINILRKRITSLTDEGIDNLNLQAFIESIIQQFRDFFSCPIKIIPFSSYEKEKISTLALNHKFSIF